jgi:hypothetical protein
MGAFFLRQKPLYYFFKYYPRQLCPSKHWKAIYSFHQDITWSLFLSTKFIVCNSTYWYFRFKWCQIIVSCCLSWYHLDKIFNSYFEINSSLLVSQHTESSVVILVSHCALHCNYQFIFFFFFFFILSQKVHLLKPIKTMLKEKKLKSSLHECDCRFFKTTLHQQPKTEHQPYWCFKLHLFLWNYSFFQKPHSFFLI